MPSADSFPFRPLHPGMGQAVAERTILRKISTEDGHVLSVDEAEAGKPFRWETWGDVAHRVALGNSLLCSTELEQQEEYELLRKHIANASLLMSGRHLQHGDETQPYRNKEVYVNCATAPNSFLLFYLLLNGSGVGRCYDDDMILVNWDNAPTVRCVMDETHADFDWSAHESVRDAKHKYGSGRDVMWFQVPDSREGWAKALEIWENAAFEKIHKDKLLILDFSGVRCKGSPIKGMQNRPSSGPVPLMNAFHKAATLRGAGLEPWLQALYIDHYFAECVLVGGARRSARMSTKTWKDKNVLDFIKVKRPIEYDGMKMEEILEFRADMPIPPTGFLWSSNNSITVDEDFWKLNSLSRKDKKFHSEEAQHARRVLRAITQAAYADGTGEPGIINSHHLVQNDEGWDNLIKGVYVGSKKYQIEEDTELFIGRLARRAKKKKFNQITNPCGEISLNILGGYCVSGNTRILTRNGYSKISDLVGTSVDVFNGENWSPVTPFKTGDGQELLRVSFSDGSFLDCTPYHEFSVRKHRQSKYFHKVKAEDLQEGWCLPVFRTPNDIIGEHESEAYTYGAFLGDGHIEERKDSGKNRYQITLYEGKHHLPVSGSRGSEQKNTGIDVTVSHLNEERLISLKGEDIPNWVFSLNRESTLDFIRGWVDTNGTYESASDGISISLSGKNKSLSLQLLLRRVGITYSSARLVQEEGTKTNLGVRNKPLWRVYIPQSEAAIISGHRVRNYTQPDLEKVVKQQRVVSVEKMEGLHSTFCFTEKERGMGVFGNVLTYQCTIADVVPFHCDSLEEAEEAFRVATRALIRVNTMDSLYKREDERTNRIGVGMTGVHEFAWKFFKLGFRDLVNEEKSMDFWLTMARFNRAVSDEAEKYSKRVGRPTPHTMTTIKPAGTTSKLFGLTEGWHLPSMAWYMRWVQFRHDDPLVSQYRDAGYPVRELQQYSGTTIVGFPTEPTIATLGMDGNMVTAGEATPEEQYRWVMLGEKYWIHGTDEEGEPIGENRGNQISYTLKYVPEIVDYKHFRNMLTKYQSQVRCCSVMPQADTSSYEYQPEQSVTKAEYEGICHAIHQAMEEDISREHVGCDTGSCPVDFRDNKVEAA